MTDPGSTSSPLVDVHSLSLSEWMSKASLVCRYETVHLAIALRWMTHAFYYIETNLDSNVQFLPINGNFLIASKNGDIQWARAVRDRFNSDQYSIWSRLYLNNITL